MIKNTALYLTMTYWILLFFLTVRQSHGRKVRFAKIFVLGSLEFLYPRHFIVHDRDAFTKRWVKPKLGPFIPFYFMLCSFLLPCMADGQAPAANYEESKVPGYTLPGLPATLPEWENSRDRLISQFENEVYGQVPIGRYQMAVSVMKERDRVLAGKADMKEIRINIITSKGELPINVLLLVPAGSSDPVPVIFGMNFYGNHSIHRDTVISLSDRWMRQNKNYGIKDNSATETSRGVRAYRWAVSKILDRGYALATFYYGDLDPDFHDGFQNGIHPLFYREDQVAPASHEWGAISAWAWGARRVMDYLGTNPQIDSTKIALFGHSRLGKTALWAGAQDKRFAAVIANNSGCGGAALSRRRFGETVQIVNNSFPHWFCANFKKYNNNESQLPVDQHQLIALIAPRPVYITSASEDLWADPKGEFLATKEASRIYSLYKGIKNPVINTVPQPGQPLLGQVSYHIRPGKHDVTHYDWERFLDFLDFHFK